MNARRDVLLRLRRHEDGTYHFNVDPDVVKHLGLKVGTYVEATLYSTNNPPERADPPEPEPLEGIVVMAQTRIGTDSDEASRQATVLSRRLGVSVVLFRSHEATVLARCNPDS